MPGTVDVERLLLQVDASIELARRNLRDLTGTVKTETANWDKALDRSSQSFDRMGKKLASTGQMRSGMAQLSFQINDVAEGIAQGTKGSMIFAQQSGQVIQALTLMNTGSSGFLRFLAGPWGIALTTAGIVLSSFAGKLFDTKDEVGKLVDKMRDQAREAQNQEAANRIWAKSLDGVREAQKKLRDELEKSLKTEDIVRQEHLASAEKGLETQKQKVPSAEKAVTDADAEVKAQRHVVSTLRSSAIGSESGAAALAAQEIRLGELEGKLKSAREALATLRADIKDSETTIRETRVALANAAADASTDASTAISSQLKNAQARLTIAGNTGKVTAEALEQARAAWNNYAKAEQDAASAGVHFAQVGKNAHIIELTRDFAQGKLAVGAYVAELKSATGALTSAAKAAENAKKGSGGSEISDAMTAKFYDTANSYRGKSETNAGDRGVLEAFFREANLKLDPEKTAWCAAFVNAVLATNGVKGTGSLAAKSFLNFGKDDTRSPQKGDVAVVSRGGQDHVGFVESVDKAGNVKVLGGNTGNKVGTATYRKSEVLAIRRPPTPSESAAAADKAADKTTDQNDAFEQEMSRLNDTLLKARAELAQGIEAQAKFAKDEVDTEEQHYEAGLKKAVDDGKLRQEQADLLVAKSREVALQKKANIEAQERLAKDEQAQRLADQTNQFRIDELRYADSIARSSDVHRKIQLEIIDLLYKQKEADLRLAKAKAEAAGKAEEAAQIQGQLDDLPKERARDTDAAKRSTMNPLEQWADQVPKTAGEINDALMSIEAHGLDSLADGIAGVIAGTTSLGDAFRNIAAQILGDIARLIARMVIMKTLMAVMGGGGSPLGLIAGGGAGADIGATMSTSFAGVASSVGGPSLASVAAGLPGMATGGFVSGPGGSTADRVPAMLSNGEFVMSAAAVSRFGADFLGSMNEGRIPHRGHGGLIGDIMPFFAGGLFGGMAHLAEHHKKLGPLAFLGGGLFGGAMALARGKGGKLGGMLGLLGGGLFGGGMGLGKLLHFAGGGLVHAAPVAPSVSAVPRSSSDNPGPVVVRSGDRVYNINVVAPDSGDPIRDQRTALQHGAALRRELGRISRTER